MKTMPVILTALLLHLPVAASAANDCRAVEFADHVELICGDVAPNAAPATPVVPAAAAATSKSEPTVQSGAAAEPGPAAEPGDTTAVEPVKESINPQPVIVPSDPGQGIKENYSRQLLRHEQAQRNKEKQMELNTPKPTPPAADVQPQTVPGK